VIDNSSAWRMGKDVPLVVPEVNRADIARHKGIIANPNCSTVQMVVALKPLHDRARIRRIVVTTFQSVSGTGKEAMEELLEQAQDLLSFKEPAPKVYRTRIAFNCLPHIDDFLPSGYTKEEMKLLNETRQDHGRQLDPGDGDDRAGAGLRRALGVGEHRDREEAHGQRGARDPLRGSGGPALRRPGHKIYPMPIDVAGRTRCSWAASARTSPSRTASTSGSSRIIYARAQP